MLDNGEEMEPLMEIERLQVDPIDDVIIEHSSDLDLNEPTFHQPRKNRSEFHFNAMSDSSDGSNVETYDNFRRKTRSHPALIYRLNPSRMRETRQYIDSFDFDSKKLEDGIFWRFMLGCGRIPVWKNIWKKFFIPIFDARHRIEFQKDEKLLVICRPHYFGNVILMFVFGLIAIGIITFLPYLLMYQMWGSQENGMIMSLFFWVAFGIFCLLTMYILIYKLLFKKLTVQYILTDRRAIITQTSPVSNEFENHVDDQQDGFRHNYTSYYFHNMSEIYFMIHQIYNPVLQNNDPSENSEKQIGTVFFGNIVENYLLPFSILTYSKYTGFYKVPNIYKVLDIIITQCHYEGGTALQAKLIRNEGELATKFISKANAICGIGMNLCPRFSSRGSRNIDSMNWV